MRDDADSFVLAEGSPFPSFLPRSDGTDDCASDAFAFCALRHEGRIAAVLLLADSPLFPGGGGVGSFLVSLVSEISAPLLSRLFRRLSFGSEPKQNGEENVEAAVDDAIRSLDRENRACLVVSIALQDLIRQTAESSPYLYTPTVERYLRALLSVLVRDFGTVHRVPGGMLLLLTLERGFDYELLLHQVATVLRGAFLSPPDIRHLIEHVRHFPKDGNDANELLAGIL